MIKLRYIIGIPLFILLSSSGLLGLIIFFCYPNWVVGIITGLFLGTSITLLFSIMEDSFEWIKEHW